jgi:hypothetical protein
MVTVWRHETPEVACRWVRHSTPKWSQGLLLSADGDVQYNRFSSIMSAAGSSEAEIKRWWEREYPESTAAMKESQNNGKRGRPLPKTEHGFTGSLMERQYFLLRCIVWKIGGRDRLIEAVSERFGGYSRATYYRDLRAIDELPLVPWTDEQLALLQKGGVDEVIRVQGQAGLEGLRASIDEWYSRRPKAETGGDG